MAALPNLTPPAAVLEAFELATGTLERATSGLINPTWYVRSTRGAELVLQRVNPIFPPAVNLDIAAVTEHLAHKGIVTPRLVPTRAGALWLEHEGAVWRVLTRIAGVCRDALESPAQAREAGRALAEFHRAVGDLDYTFQNARLGVHDTPRHLKGLRDALVEHAAHRDIAAIRPLAERVLALAASLPALPASGDRIVHGDPKISNLMFAADGDRALCLIDLDTLSRMPVALELGDALRSWCNPATEDATNARFVREYFEAAVGGYAAAAHGFLTENEWRAIPLGTLTVTVELAARFCADALRERYFGWDNKRYASASAHNQARTRGQLQVATSIAAEMGALDAITESAMTSTIKTFGSSDFTALAEQAKAAPRRRANLNVHASTEANVQRLFIATEPDTYMRPHRHTESHKWEFFAVLRGRLDLLVFSDAGELVQRVTLSPTTTPAVEIPPGVFHAYVCMQPGTIGLEVKEGAYIPTPEHDFAPWSPAERSAGVAGYLAWLRTAQPPAVSPAVGGA